MSVLCLTVISAVFAYYYEIDGGVYGDEYDDTDSNHIKIEFYKGGVTIQNGGDYVLADSLSECIYRQTKDPYANITTLKNELTQICHKHGLINPNITITTPYGDDNFIYTVKAVGISMYPTIKNGDMLILNKTHDFHVDDLVSANYPSSSGGIVKRVAAIKGDSVYLISDNVNGSYVKNGEIIEYEGIRTWVNMSDIQGVVIEICDNSHDVIFV